MPFSIKSNHLGVGQTIPGILTLSHLRGTGQINSGNFNFWRVKPFPESLVSLFPEKVGQRYPEYSFSVGTP